MIFLILLFKTWAAMGFQQVAPKMWKNTQKQFVDNFIDFFDERKVYIEA